MEQAKWTTGHGTLLKRSFVCGRLAPATAAVWYKACSWLLRHWDHVFESLKSWMSVPLSLCCAILHTYRPYFGFPRVQESTTGSRLLAGGRGLNKNDIKFLTSGLHRRVGWWKFTDVSEVYTASIIRATHLPDDGRCTNLWNVGKLLAGYTALQSRRQQPSAYAPPWQTKIILRTIWIGKLFSRKSQIHLYARQFYIRIA
jgi:hypothetical protein